MYYIIDYNTCHVWGEDDASCSEGGMDEGDTVVPRDGDDDWMVPPCLPDGAGEGEEGGHAASPRHVEVCLYHANFFLRLIENREQCNIKHQRSPLHSIVTKQPNILYYWYSLSTCYAPAKMDYIAFKFQVFAMRNTKN